MKLDNYKMFIEKCLQDRYEIGRPMDSSSLLLELVGEVGEMINAHKHVYVWPDGVDTPTHVAEEIGDCFWYLFALCATLELDAEKILEQNKNKLEERYGGNYESKN